MCAARGNPSMGRNHAVPIVEVTGVGRVEGCAPRGDESKAVREGAATVWLPKNLLGVAIAG